MTTESKDIVSKKRILLERLFAKLRLGIKPGLERTLQLSEFVGSPHKKIKSVHIAGTNGKGSVASVIASVLTESGLKTGLYTSPHLVDFNERIRINGKMISDEEIVNYAEELLEFAESINCTFFEITTVMAFKYFADNQTDICIIETGMGGRFDSTNILMPLLTIITSIGIDHTEFLGETKELIAFEKAGIIKASTPCIIGESAVELAHVFQNAAKQVNADLIFAGDRYNFENISYNSNFKTSARAVSVNKSFDIVSVLPGNHQLSNLKSSLTAIDLLIDLGYKIDEMTVRNGIENVYNNTGLTGRIQTIREKPLLLLDVSHNPEAISELLKTIKLHSGDKQKFTIIFGAMADKDIRSMLEILKPITQRLFLSKLKIDRAESPENIAQMAAELQFGEIVQFEDVKSAYESIADDDTIITGSFYLAGEMSELIL
ncbi:MAG: dihydrofolate synthase [Ignavibacteriae bacterium HGW-Ignavibacteriae-1]|jgi:dihydrofolate synthase/folylpolyglutamate synthase|nr:MAG: dihydrofolate synthase [Ignavibacteriae bacterium HGW-Ignavibacteriae-1]